MSQMNWARVHREDRQRSRTASTPTKPRTKNTKPAAPPPIVPAARIEAEAWCRDYTGQRPWVLSVQERLRLPIRALTEREYAIVVKIRREEEHVGFGRQLLQANSRRDLPERSAVVADVRGVEATVVELPSAERAAEQDGLERWVRDYDGVKPFVLSVQERLRKGVQLTTAQQQVLRKIRLELASNARPFDRCPVVSIEAARRRKAPSDLSDSA